MDEDTCQDLIDQACTANGNVDNKPEAGDMIDLKKEPESELEEGEIIDIKNKKDTPVPPKVQDFDLPPNPFTFIMKEPTQQVSYLCCYLVP